MFVSCRTIAILALLGLTASCDARENGLGPGTSNPDRTSPTVVSTLPSNNSAQVNRRSPITITFSEPMATASMVLSTFTFSPSIGGTLSYTGNTATFTPSNPLAADVLYTATVTTAAEDRSGNNMSAPFSWTFRSDPAPLVP